MITEENEYSRKKGEKSLNKQLQSTTNNNNKPWEGEGHHVFPHHDIQNVQFQTET